MVRLSHLVTPNIMDAAHTDQGSSPAPSSGDLAVLGVLAAGIPQGDFGSYLDTAAELLRASSGADDCEIYLCEPEGEDLVLAACAGRDAGLLRERTRFGRGVGYPGISLATNSTLTSRHLERDSRFIRKSLPTAGIVTFVSTPMAGHHGPVGCITLAWRKRSANMERGTELLPSAGTAIATVVRATLLDAREKIGQAVEAGESDVDIAARTCLQVLVRESGARAGTLALYDSRGGGTMLVRVGDSAGICATAADGRVRCDLLAQGHGVVREGPRVAWPEPCQCLPESSHTSLCLPLRHAGRLQGVVVLDRGPGHSEPASRDLIPLLTMANEAAARLAPLRAPRVEAGTHVAADSVLEVRCLGGFSVRLRQQSVAQEAFTRKKAISLLKILILNAGNPLHREALAERLWPGIDPGSAANRLHGVLHALRNAIEPFRQQRRWIYVCNIGELYHFNMESPHWIDVYEFRRHAAGAREAERRGRTADALREIEAALALYQGELFADDPYASWCELERAELQHRYVDLTAQAAALWEKAGQPERGIDWLRRGLLADPLREDLHQILIRKLLDLGRRNDARQQYLECLRLLREDLDADPLPETRGLERLLGDLPLTVDPAMPRVPAV